MAVFSKHFCFIVLFSFFMPMFAMEEFSDKITNAASPEEIESLLKTKKFPSVYATAALPVLASGPPVDHKIIDILIKFADARDLKDLVSNSPLRASCRRSAYVQQQIEKKINELFPEQVMTTSFVSEKISQEPFDIDQERLDSADKLMSKKASNKKNKNSLFSYIKWAALGMSIAYVVYYLYAPKINKRIVKSA
jgi:hypothetical protein